MQINWQKILEKILMFDIVALQEVHNPLPDVRERMKEAYAHLFKIITGGGSEPIGIDITYQAIVEMTKGLIGFARRNTGFPRSGKHR